MSILEKPLAIKIKKLDINQAYFFGTAEIDGVEYKINIQGHWKEKLIKLPIKHPQKDKVLIRLTGESDAMIENIVARAKKAALKRYLSKNEKGIKPQDLLDAAGENMRHVFFR